MLPAALPPPRRSRAPGSLHSPDPPPPSAGATPFASPWRSRRRSTVPTAAAAGAAGGSGAAALRRQPRPGGAWRGNPEKLRAGAGGAGKNRRDQSLAPPRCPAAQAASMRLSPVRLPPSSSPSRPSGHQEFPSAIGRSPYPELAVRWAESQARLLLRLLLSGLGPSQGCIDRVEKPPASRGEVAVLT